MSNYKRIIIVLTMIVAFCFIFYAALGAEINPTYNVGVQTLFPAVSVGANLKDNIGVGVQTLFIAVSVGSVISILPHSPVSIHSFLNNAQSYNASYGISDARGSYLEPTGLAWQVNPFVGYTPVQNTRHWFYYTVSDNGYTAPSYKLNHPYSCLPVMFDTACSALYGNLSYLEASLWDQPNPLP